MLRQPHATIGDPGDNDSTTSEDADAPIILDDDPATSEADASMVPGSDDPENSNADAPMIPDDDESILYKAMVPRRSQGDAATAASCEDAPGFSVLAIPGNDALATPGFSALTISGGDSPAIPNNGAVLIPGDEALPAVCTSLQGKKQTQVLFSSL